MMDWSSDTWTEKELRFNHDWLSNRLIINLRAVQTAIKHGELSQNTLDRAIQCLRQWKSECAVAVQVLDQIPSALCYTRHLKVLPLCKLPDELRNELGSCLSSLWEQRLANCCDIGAARTLLAQGTKSCEELKNCFEANGVWGVKSDGACSQELITALRNAVELSDVFTRLRILADLTWE